MNWLRRGAASI